MSRAKILPALSRHEYIKGYPPSIGCRPIAVLRAFHQAEAICTEESEFTISPEIRVEYAAVRSFRIDSLLCARRHSGKFTAVPDSDVFLHAKYGGNLWYFANQFLVVQQPTSFYCQA